MNLYNIRELKSQILRFGVVGFIAFIIDYLLLYVLTESFGIYYLVSALIAFCVSLTVNYMLSTKWVFKVKQSLNKQKRFMLFVVLSIVGLGINEIIIYISVEVLSIYYMLGKFIATAVVMLWNFISRKLILEDFRKGEY